MKRSMASVGLLAGVLALATCGGREDGATEDEGFEGTYTAPRPDMGAGTGSTMPGATSTPGAPLDTSGLGSLIDTIANDTTVTP